MGLFSSKKKNIDGRLGNYKLKHIDGLNIPQGVFCEAILYNDKLILKASSNEYALNLKKINAVDFGFDLDEKKYQKSSMVKGVIGAATFGVAGAVIGSAPKTKTERKVTGKIIINFKSSEEEDKFIVLEDFQENTHNSAQLYDKLKPLVLVDEKKHIEL